VGIAEYVLEQAHDVDFERLGLDDIYLVLQRVDESPKTKAFFAQFDVLGL
tara:strand:- start:8 stop:157 length:150 start_codon:yes stop_codon:yes gene_type:complete